MKKLIAIVSIIIAAFATSYAQDPGQEKNGTEKSSKREGGLFHHSHSVKPRNQMKHFDSSKQDSSIQHNGTEAYNDMNKAKRKRFQKDNKNTNKVMTANK